jgi:phage-related holin
MLRTAIIFFYCSNEGVSMLENAGRLGLPIPEKLKDILAQLHNKGGEQ